MLVGSKKTIDDSQRQEYVTGKDGLYHICLKSLKKDKENIQKESEMKLDLARSAFNAQIETLQKFCEHEDYFITYSHDHHKNEDYHYKYCAKCHKYLGVPLDD